MQIKQVCIKVGCVPPACWLYRGRGGGCIGGSAQPRGWVCIPGGSASGGSASQGGLNPGGLHLGGSASRGWGLGRPPPPCEQNDIGVKTLPCPQTSFAGGKNSLCLLLESRNEYHNCEVSVKNFVSKHVLRNLHVRLHSKIFISSMINAIMHGKHDAIVAQGAVVFAK